MKQGDRLGPYEILARLGAGSMGDVYRAKDPRLGRQVAIKVLRLDTARDKRARIRFGREARAVAALSHPNILVIHDIGIEGGQPYVVTELLEGRTLRQQLDTANLPWPAAVELAVAIVDGLEAAHARGIVHRDLKPDNIFLEREGRVKILDFGLAMLTGNSPPGVDMASTDGLIVGTFGYMSPEQSTGSEIDHRTDLFSLGCLLYEAISGQRAFQPGGSIAALFAAVLHDNPAPLMELAPKIPADLEQVVMRCLRKDRGERFQSAADLALALRSLLHQTPGLTQGAASGDTSGITVQPAQTKLPGHGIQSIAVLPFANVGGSDADYLADGLSESIIRDLSRSSELRVIGWSTVSRYKGQVPDAIELGKALAIDAMLSGRVVEREGQLLITADLVDTRSGDHLWGDRYPRSVERLFEVQEEIARDIAERLRVEVRARSSDIGKIDKSVDPEAYKAYLKGRYFWNLRTPAALRQSRELFTRSLEIDPSFALAHAGLADSFNVLPFWGLAAPSAAFPEAKAAAQKALELDPLLAEAHASLAYAQFYFDRDWRSARHSFERALELTAGSASARHGFGVCAALMGDFETAFSQLKTAQRIDPLSLIVNADLGLCWYWYREPQRALEQAESALALESGFVPAHVYRGLALEQLQRYDEAAAAFHQAIDLSRSSSLALAGLGHTLAVSGQLQPAREVLLQLSGMAQRQYVSNYPIAVIYAGLEQVEMAIEWLRRAFDEHSEMLSWMRVDPRLDPLRDEPEFAELAAEVDSRISSMIYPRVDGSR